MYRKFYGLQKKPFHTTPDPSFLYLSPSHKEALGAMLYGIDHRKGFIAITGEVGVGKTTVVRSFLEQVDWQEENTHLIYLYNPTLSVGELLSFILSELERVPIETSNAGLFQELQQVLVEKYRQGGTVVLLIDEAQNMSPKTLEHLRMLSNLETSTDKLLQIVLVGQPELETLLQHHDLRQLRQRIAVWATIRALSEQESFDYITHRLVIASLTGKHIFSKHALTLIVEQAAGIPRRLNILCDNSLVTGVGYRKNPITAKIVREVISDIDKETSKRWWWWMPATAALLFLVLGAWLLFTLSRPASNQTAQEKNTVDVERPIERPIPNPTLALIPQKPLKEQGASNVMPPTIELSQSWVDSNETDSDFENSSPSIPASAQNTDPVQIAKQSPAIEDTMPNHVPENRESVLVASESGERPFKNSKDDKDLPEELTATSYEDVTGPSTSSDMQSLDQGSLPEQPVSASTQVEDFQTRVIKRGDTLAELIKEVYGTSDPELLEFVLQHNPHITHVRKIVPGQTVTFPALSKFAMDTLNPMTPDSKTSTSQEMNEPKKSKVILTKTQSAPQLQPSSGPVMSKVFARRIIQEGDSLSSLIKSIYGSTGPERIQQVLEHNPHIRNARMVFPGQEVVFPDVDASRSQ